MRIWRVVAALSVMQAAHADTGVDDLTLSRSFELRATVVRGCLLGTGSADVSSFGTLNFGQFGSLPNDVQASSSEGAGTIVLHCTPGTAVTVALNAGMHSSDIAGGRYLGKGAERLRYQLYQDASNSTVWGTAGVGGNALSIIFGAAGIQRYPVYARLFNADPMPSAGIYSDTVTVTISY
ncbi:MAG: spore coat U domain-containing protein [Gammaproteobacteria bacterium]|nr:spore coat U domain-containing protein [Gammaproteobacteria bacterium]MBU2066996.1 spore coat U domain-containing protein [Gammaproteobacteria bacterium]MBU2138965.1 spore coat U domain-containing protein [Gammaproteobacteria bacterium]MBU2216310.1 spore coat U domain-containing protein [Gammaproteobacteria bacterium]MBU2322816.1 spore coat U domain-containing protein [Gammaproteobacteria bacterium]